jgi:hypothetical protein
LILQHDICAPQPQRQFGIPSVFSTTSSNNEGWNYHATGDWILPQASATPVCKTMQNSKSAEFVENM